jgi:hypothetical protein
VFLQGAVFADFAGIGQVSRAPGLIANLQAGTDEKFVLGAFGISQLKHMSKRSGGFRAHDELISLFQAIAGDCMFFAGG